MIPNDTSLEPQDTTAEYPLGIYLAGKIQAEGDWRTGILEADQLRSRSYDLRKLSVIWPAWDNAIFEEHSYTGPFFIACDHGCYHGDNSHGVAANTEYLCMGDSFDDGTIGRRKKTLRLCREAIIGSDIVFAWLNDPTAYGTIAELGFADGYNRRVSILPQERRINIYIASDVYLPDMWFVYEMASQPPLIREGLTPREALRHFIREYHFDYKTYLQSDAWKVKRKAALERAGNRCQICNYPHRLDVHHRTYERIGDEQPDDLTVLCRRCHATFHTNGRLTK